MKKLLILLILFSSCSTPEQLMVQSTQVIKGDTVTTTEYANFTRQQRLALKDEMKHKRKLYRDSILHNVNMYKEKTKRIEDSLKYENKETKEAIKIMKVNSKIYSDSLNNDLKKLKILHKIYQDSIDGAIKILKVENNKLKIENKNIKQYQKHTENLYKQEVKSKRKRSLWWVWIIIGTLVASIGLNLFLLYFKK